jgi:hypothetical protein
VDNPGVTALFYALVTGAVAGFVIGGALRALFLFTERGGD